MQIRRLRSTALAAGLSLASASLLSAQTQVTIPPIDFSGVIYSNYQYRTDIRAKDFNKFDVERVYLTFRMPAGDDGAIRITTDVFQNTNTAQNAYYQGWAVRLKYAYLQYTGLKNDFGAGSSLVGRIGILHTVVIDHEEGFWPRYLQQTAIERNGFFSSADGGAAGLMTLGHHLGEIYATITNGPGYTSYEKDRFKDLAARVSLTPFGNQQNMNGIIKSFTISPWAYKGLVGSAFQSGGNLQVGPGDNGAITDGLIRDRYGVFVGVKDRRLTGGAEWAQRKDVSETGSNTAAAPRVVHDSTGRLLDGFIVARPLEWADASQHSPLSIVARFDHFTPNTSPTAAAYAGTTPSLNFWVLGASWDLNQRLTFALDWQKQTGSDFPEATGTNLRAPADLSTLFLHFQANF